MSGYILKNSVNRVYAPYGGELFSNVMDNAEIFPNEAHAVFKAIEIKEKHPDIKYIQIIPVV